MAGRMSSSRTKPHDVHRGRGPGAGASVAQLAGPVVAPALDGATGDHRARVRRAGRDGDRPRTEPRDLDRDVGVGRACVAQPAGRVVAPAPDHANRGHGTDVRVAGADRDHPRVRTEPGDLNRAVRACQEWVRVPQLAGTVEAPAPNRSTDDATADHRAGVRPAGGDRDHARARTEPDNVNRDVGAGESPVAQPTGPVVAPALDATGSGDRAGMGGAGGDHRRLDQCGGAYRRRGGIGRRSVMGEQRVGVSRTRGQADVCVGGPKVWPPQGRRPDSRRSLWPARCHPGHAGSPPRSATLQSGWSTTGRRRWCPGSLTGVVIRRAPGDIAPATATDGSPVAVPEVAKPGTTYTDTGLTSGARYSYA